MDIVLILTLILFNGFFAMAEIAIVSSRKISDDPRTYLKNYRHSRIIFARGVIDKIEGVIHIKDLLQTYLDDIFESLVGNIKAQNLLVIT